jgi:sugar (pentulose or hexulose) kinase
VSDYLIGLDIGASMSKAALFDRRGPEVGATGRRTRVRHPHPGWNEMEAEDLFAAASGACRALLAETRVNPKEIRGLGISAVMVGGWLIDAEGAVLRAPATLTMVLIHSPPG